VSQSRLAAGHADPASGRALDGGVYATSSTPFEIREPFSILTTRLESASWVYPIYELTTLAGMDFTNGGSNSARGIRSLSAGRGFAANAETADSGALLLLTASFQAQSFSDPFTLRNYVRARWYDPGTGTFLTPDPLGYRDSSNLYAFAGGDPVNGRDPSGERTANAADKAAIMALKEKIAAYQQSWLKNRRATFTDYFYRAKPRWYSANAKPEYAYRPYEIEATNEAEYRRGLWLLQNDLSTFESAVARADDDGTIYYVPNPASGGYMTRTRADEASAQRWDIAVNVGFFVTDVVPSWFAPTRVEPVAELKGGRYKAPIPISTLQEGGLTRPHGIVKDSGLPAQGYTLRNRSTGEILKYGETTRGEQRYSRSYLRQINAEMVIEVSGTKAEMHAWQHQKILEYKSSHGGQRPPLNKSDY
jgi:RHS repeat-associated protein